MGTRNHIIVSGVVFFREDSASPRATYVANCGRGSAKIYSTCDLIHNEDRNHTVNCTWWSLEVTLTSGWKGVCTYRLLENACNYAIKLLLYDTRGSFSSVEEEGIWDSFGKGGRDGRVG